MNWDIIKGKWDQFKGEAKEQWAKLTDDDWSETAGDRDKLSGKLQERYGWVKNDAEKAIDDWFRPRSDKP